MLISTLWDICDAQWAYAGKVLETVTCRLKTIVINIDIIISHLILSPLSPPPPISLSHSLSYTHTHTHKSRFEGQYHLMASLNHIFWQAFFELLERQHSLGKQHWARNGPRYRLPSRESTSKESIFLNVLVTLYTFIL